MDNIPIIGIIPIHIQYSLCKIPIHHQLFHSAMNRIRFDPIRHKNGLGARATLGSHQRSFAFLQPALHLFLTILKQWHLSVARWCSDAGPSLGDIEYRGFTKIHKKPAQTSECNILMIFYESFDIIFIYSITWECNNWTVDILSTWGWLSTE